MPRETIRPPKLQKLYDSAKRLAKLKVAKARLSKFTKNLSKPLRPQKKPPGATSTKKGSMSTRPEPSASSSPQEEGSLDNQASNPQADSLPASQPPPVQDQDPAEE